MRWVAPARFTTVQPVFLTVKRQYIDKGESSYSDGLVVVTLCSEHGVTGL